MATNLRLVGAYKSELATATASSTAAGFDAQNVVALDRPTKWKANVTTASWVKLDLGSTKAVDTVCLANHNGNLWTTALLEWSNDGSTGWTTAATLSGLAANTDYFATFASQTKQFWRVSTASASSAMEIGCFYLGTLTTLTKNPSYPGEDSDTYNVERARATSGTIVAEKYGRRLKKFDFIWRYPTLAVVNEVRNFLRVEDGPLRPFWYIPPDESGASTNGEAFMVRFDPLAFEVTRHFLNTYEFGVTFREEA